MYYVRQEARQVALRFAARISGLVFRDAPVGHLGVTLGGHDR